MTLGLTRRTLLGVLLFAALGVGLFAFFAARFGGPSLSTTAPLRLHATLADAQGIGHHADVLVHGVGVGVVGAVRRRGARATITLELDRDELPALHRDAEVHVGAKTPLGEAFVALDPGSRGPARPARDGAAIAAREAVEVDEALDVLDAPARADLRAVLRTLERGARSPAAAARVNATLAELEHAVGALDELAAALHGQEGDIAAAVGDTRALLRPLAAQRAAVRSLVASARGTLGAVSARGPALEAGLRELPVLLRRARATLREAVPLTAEAAAPLDDLRRASPALTRALEASPRPLADLARVLDRAPALQRSAAPALRGLRALVPEARPAVRRLGPALANVVPMARYLEPRTSTIAAWFTNTDDLGRNGDAKGRWARFFIGFDPATALGATTGAPPENPYTRPGDAAANRPYAPGDFPRLLPYAPAVGNP